MGWTDTRATRLLGIRLPITLAGMAGGPTTTELVAAVSEAGGLGTLGAGTFGPDALRTAIRALRERTTRPFGVNLLLPPALEPTPGTVEPVVEALAPFRAELGIDAVPEARGQPPGYVEAQLAVLVEERVPAFSFAFGYPPDGAIDELRGAGTLVFGTAMTVAEAAELERLGCDGVIAQGAEAGGHRAGVGEPAAVGLVALVPAVADAVEVPVVAAGGIMDGRGIAAALALGAHAVQLGTAFLVTEESGAPEAYKAAVLDADETSTQLTTAYTGRAARAIRTPLLERLEQLEVPPYPWQASLTAAIREAAGKAGRADLLLLLAGQGTRLARRLPAAELMAALEAETEAAVRKLL